MDKVRYTMTTDLKKAEVAMLILAILILDRDITSGQGSYQG